MNETVQEIMAFVNENDVKFIRLGFCDPFGLQKNISVMQDELLRAFTQGVSFDASAIRAFSDVAQSDLLLFPDPATMTMLPWRPEPGRVIRFYCDIRKPDGEPFMHDGRYLLKKVLKRYEDNGYICKIGAECEFYLFKTDEQGNPTIGTLDKGGYMDISPLDKGENIRREICLTLREMGLHPESSHHEQGPGQNEVDFKFSDALTSADNFMTFKSVVKAIAARNGLFASFMPKPLADASGSGMHVNISLVKNGRNIFTDTAQKTAADSFLAGVLLRAREMALFLNPLTNSYARLGRLAAPKYVSWSPQNRSQLIRMPVATDERVRMELRQPDPSVNPYLAYALIAAAGLEGIEQGLTLPLPVNENLYTIGTEAAQTLELLPESLAEAIEIAEASAFVQRTIDGGLLAKYLTYKKEEAEAYAASVDKARFDRERYFTMI